MGSVELIFEIEKEFQIEISDIEAEQISTVGDIYKIILRRTKVENDESGVYESLVELISKNTGIKAEVIKLNSYIVHDLKID